MKEPKNGILFTNVRILTEKSKSKEKYFHRYG
jgi:hypothetical protein